MPPERDPNRKEESELLFDADMLDIDEISMIDPIPGDIVFYVDNSVEKLKICANGDFMVDGKVVKNDMDVYNGFVEFLKESGHY